MAASKQRKALEAELQRKRRWYYISFANVEGHLGSAIVRAHGELTAEQRCRELNIHPGNGPGIGDVVCMALGWRDMQRIREDLRNRLLSEKEVLDRLEGTRL